MDADRATRIAQNESIYRTVNEKIEGLNRAFEPVLETMSIVCECGDVACARQIEADVVTYERVRADPLLFFVIPGHEITDVEDVVEERDGYLVVRKSKPPGQGIALETDNRS
jgi:hypothetical protein